jgi:cytoskeletal protein CcmA (bactofilin family)
MSFFGSRKQAEPAPPPTPQKPQPPPQHPVPQQPVGFETVLGANCTLEGKLHSNANVRLDGTFTGTLEISGNVLVGETAKITADINAKNISIAGAVRGNVTGKKVQLLRTGRIWGDITATALTTEEGAFIDGKITMLGQEPAKPAPAAEARPEEPPSPDIQPDTLIVPPLSEEVPPVPAASEVTAPPAPETPNREGEHKTWPIVGEPPPADAAAETGPQPDRNGGQ